IAQLLLFLAETGLQLEGRNLGELRLVGKMAPGTSYYGDIVFKDPQKVFAFMLQHLRRFHRIVEDINDEIRAVYEIIALAWTASELYTHLPLDEARRLENKLLRDEVNNLREDGLIGSKHEASQFRKLYAMYFS